MSNEAAVHDDLVPEQTEGFKVGEKKTIDEYQKLGKSRKEISYRETPHAMSLHRQSIMAVSIPKESRQLPYQTLPRHYSSTPHSHLHLHRPKR